MQVKWVACKRFHASNPNVDSKRELQNLEILKESITSHAHIRIHLAVLFHKGEHLILLPWAEHFDLDYFLAEGHDFRGKEVYSFATQFPLARKGAMIKDVCVQMYRIAAALAWLHEGVIGIRQEGRLYFAHMDLKPNNILIDRDPSSVVGKWVLTDFGISAFREDDGSTPSDLLSIRGLYERLTIKTTPRRQAGAYQPPEVQHVRRRNSGDAACSNEKSVGRKGDIWSFACIFSEALTFALGKASAVDKFRAQRTGRHDDDYFYESVTSQHLQPNADHHMYQVRAEVLEWLRRLVYDEQPPNRGIECCVSTILQTLVTDGSQRPKAEQLVFMMNHVKQHFSADKKPVDPRSCPLNHTNALNNRVTSDKPASGVPTIMIERATHYSAPVPGSVVPSDNTPNIQRSSLKQDGDERYQPVVPDENSSVRRHSSVPSLFQNDPQSPDEHWRRGSTESRVPISGNFPSELYGVTVNAKIQRTVRGIKQFPMLATRKVKVHDISLCPYGLRVAQLRSTSDSQTREVVVYNIDLALGRCEELSCVTLSLGCPDRRWKHLVLSGDKLVVWGKAQDDQNIVRDIHFSRYSVPNRLKVCLSDGTNELMTWIATSCAPLSSLLSVSLSTTGCLAFVCTEKVYYVKKK